MQVGRSYIRQYKGQDVTVFGTGAAADQLGTYPMMLISWEKRKWIPKPVFNEKYRFYMQYQIELMRGLLAATKMKKATEIAKAVEKIYDNWE